MNILSDRIWSPIKTRSFFMSMRVPLFKNPKDTLINLQIHHPLVLGKCNKFTSFLEIYVIMVGCNCLWLSKFLHILLRFGTNLAARIDGTTIGGVTGVYITCHGYNRKTPMVELVTINKHCREIAQTLKKISSTKQIKARTCCQFLCTLGYSLSLTIFRTRGMRCMRT